MGKSEVARGFVRAAVGEEGMTVASPTFVLEQRYAAAAATYAAVHHLDLYRLTPGQERPLLIGTDPAAVYLVEWPERLAAAPACRRLFCLALESRGTADVPPTPEGEGEWPHTAGASLFAAGCGGSAVARAWAASA